MSHFFLVPTLILHFLPCSDNSKINNEPQNDREFWRDFFQAGSDNSTQKYSRHTRNAPHRRKNVKMVRKLTKFSYQCGYKISLEVLASPKIVSELKSKFCPLLEKRWLFLNHGNKNITPSRKLTINFRQIISFQDRNHRQPSRIYIGQFQQIRSKKLKKIRNVAQGVGIGYLVNPCLEDKGYVYFEGLFENNRIVSDYEKQAMKLKDCMKPRRLQDETDTIIPIKNSSKKNPKRPAMDAWNPTKCPIYKGQYDAYNRKFDQTSCTS